MIGSDRGRGGIALCVAALTVLAAASSCEDFPRTNPFDQHAVLTLVLTGPDSVTAIGDTISFEVRTAKGEAVDQLATWDVPSFLAPLNAPGKFLVTGGLPTARGAGTLTVHVDASQSSKTILFAQKATSLSLGWCPLRIKTTTFTALTPPSDPMRDVATVCNDLLDRRGNVVRDSSTLSGVIRDTSIVRFVTPDQLNVNAFAVGSTWIVYARAGLTDSLRAVVRQDPVSLTIDPPNCNYFTKVYLAPGDTVQITARGPVVDAHQNPLADTTLARSNTFVDPMDLRSMDERHGLADGARDGECGESRRRRLCRHAPEWRGGADWGPARSSFNDRRLHVLGRYARYVTARRSAQSATSWRQSLGAFCFPSFSSVSLPPP